MALYNSSNFNVSHHKQTRTVHKITKSQHIHISWYGCTVLRVQYHGMVCSVHCKMIKYCRSPFVLIFVNSITSSNILRKDCGTSSLPNTSSSLHCTSCSVYCPIYATKLHFSFALTHASRICPNTLITVPSSLQLKFSSLIPPRNVYPRLFFARLKLTAFF